MVTLVNPRHNADMQVDCEIRGATPRQGRAEILHDPDINAYNSFDNPNRVVIRPHPVAVENGRIRVALPAMSVATVTLQVASGLVEFRTFNRMRTLLQIGRAYSDGGSSRKSRALNPLRESRRRLHAASNFLLMSSPSTGSDSLIVSFAAPVLGAGLFTIDRFFGTGFTNDLVIEAYTGADATGTLLGSFSGLSANFQTNNLYFMGITSSAADIGSIRLLRSNDNSGDAIGVDNILFATGTSNDGAVPEPASVTLLAAGLAIVGTFRRIRKA